jgi:hypothetical protein
VRALTVRQPWAWAIIHAGKDIENRNWSNRHCHGTIAIHASKRAPAVHALPRGVRCPDDEELVRGAIVGVVDIVGIVERHRSRWLEGPIGWVLRNPRALRAPIRLHRPPRPVVGAFKD